MLAFRLFLLLWLLEIILGEQFLKIMSFRQSPKSDISASKNINMLKIIDTHGHVSRKVAIYNSDQEVILHSMTALCRQIL